MRILGNAALALILIPSVGTGQSIVLGLNTGATRSTQTEVDPAPRQFTGRWAPTVGAFAAVPLSSAIAVRFETNYVAKGYWGASYAVNISYLELPLLMQVRLWGERPVRPLAVLGLARSLKLGCTVDNDLPNQLEGQDVLTGEPCAGRYPKDWDTSVVLGTGVEFETGPVDAAVQVRYVRGLGSAYQEDAGPRSSNQTLYLMFALSRLF
jgi:hypothetical protein